MPGGKIFPQHGDVFSIDYTLKNDADSVIDSSQDAEPLVYLQGAENIIPALEKALEGKVVEDKLQVSIDGNHPLAGERLHFDVAITEVRDASEDELKHGHVHGEGCNH